MTVEEILKAIKETNYEFYGIRGWDETYKIGQVLPESVEWDYEYDQPTENEVGGTCTTLIDFYQGVDEDKEIIEAIEKALEIQKTYYHYPNLYLVGSDVRNPYNAYEADENEAILANATVINKIK
ncbi:hypothetical protein [Streptococcus oralis]|uniref:Phage protein n=1 Tax=Streptococcus oralis subsp. oralis TaxID=1891914 RepID=A0A1X1IFL0_STROR|nr:hypothetical protein [Streptococcus oralis]ORO47587.1 hypothetical protein B7723_09830 [Streptococcus oralis subsp. oralis]ORO71839.1 hypothetical protein B7712_04070 [Streptococcus oralis subsp. oralis]